MAQALALMLVAGGVVDSAHAAPAAFSSGWFGAMGSAQSQMRSSGVMPNGALAGIPTAAQQQQQSQQQLQQSLNNLNRTAAAIAAQQAAQAAARLAAMNAPSGVPDGLVDGGLKIDTNALTKGWINATAPTQSTSNGKTTVAIQQTADKAILNWETFNVGKNTTVQFGQQADWAVLNRVNDPSARPSQIQGQIKGTGTVMVMNRNGVIFSGSSQVNVRNLVAAAADITDKQFTANGIYSTQTGGAYVPSFTNASGQLVVDAGAQITTANPGSVTQGGGYVLLMGQQVSNAGDIETPKGQVGLAAGDSFIIRRGVGTDANQSSTTRGNEISPQLNIGSTAGQVINTGLLLAREGDVTLAGHDVQQNGTAIATTSINTRGTIHLLNSASDAAGLVTLGANAVTAVVIEDDGTALDSQRAALLASSAAQDLVRPGAAVGQFDNLSKLTDRQDQGRIEIVSGGDVRFEGNSLSLATGGQIAVSAAKRTFVAAGSVLDVAGDVGVNLAMASNNVQVNVQGNELRDSPDNRDSGNLANNNIWIDRRDLTLVPAGTGGYTSDRWYTAGGLLEVSGYLNNQGHSIGEWAAQGGTVQLGGSEVVTQTGSQINLSGGSLNVETGYVALTWLVGSDGRYYDIDNAPADMTFRGIYKGYESAHPRWGKEASEFFYNPLIAPRKRLENGYTVGRDAGQLIINAPTAVIEGDIIAQVFTGGQQTRARDAIGDSYLQSQTAVAKAASLSFGQYGAGGLNGANGTDLVIGNLADITRSMADDDTLAADRINTTWLDAGRLNSQGFGEIDLASSKSVSIEAPLALADGGALAVTAPVIDIDAGITAHGGSIALGNLIRIPPQGLQLEQWSMLPALPGAFAQVTIGADSVLDLTGVWTNTLTDPDHLAGLPYLHGGSLTVSTTGGIALAAGSVVDVSSGGAILSNGTLQGGKGGNVSLITNNYAHFSDAVWFAADRTAPLVFDGAVRAYGFNGGGTLTLSAPQTVAIGGAAPSAVTGPILNLDASLFQSGFTAYDITGSNGMQIADGTMLAPAVPVYRLNDATLGARSGSNIADAADLWTPPVFTEDAEQGKLTQRIGADVTLVSTRGDFLLPRNAAITVDPGRAVDLYINGQTTVEGDITTPGGSILIASAEEQPKELRVLNGNGAFSLARSIWIGENAVLDVAGYGKIATDVRGRNYGTVADGGAIALGGANGAASDAFVIVRPGAVLDVSGAAATIDLINGNTATPTRVASNGGLIALNSNSGIYIDGTLHAEAGGAGASGGTLSMNLVSRHYSPTPDNQTTPGGIGDVSEELRKLRNITITQQREASGLGSDVPGQADAGLLFGSAAISADQIAQGGFASLALHTSDLFVFKGDVNLLLPRSLTLAGGILSVSDATPNINVALSAPYVSISGFTEDSVNSSLYNPGLIGALPSLQHSASSFSVAADLLDITGGVRFGVHGAQGSGSLRYVGEGDPNNILNPGVAVDAAGFGQVNFTSRGDIRIGNGRLSTDNSSIPGGFLKTSGDLTLTAAQIYPLSGASASIYAGLIAQRTSSGGIQGSENFDPAQPKTITIRRIGDDLPPQPASAFGIISFLAATVDQGGVVRAPLGVVNLNRNISTTPTPPDSSVIFRAGSVTSASANGLIMPFGGTTDGVSYQGADGTLVDLGAATNFSGTGITTGISVGGISVVAEAGALLDLTGGGVLTGAGFVTGRGGSVDTLKTPLVNSNPANKFSAAGNQVYAIMPGYGAAYAPMIAANGAGDPAIGRQVTIPAGVPGLPAGTYTLLPSSYALLPGAFRVEVGAAGTSMTAPLALPGGSYLASATMSVANTGIHDALPTQLILSSGKEVRSTSQYNETSYADFERNQAAIFGNIRPRLPEDGKILQLDLGASTDTPALSFAGTALFGPGAGSDGIAGSLLITSSAPSNIIDVTAPGAAPIAGHTAISSADINAFNAASLFLGGAYVYANNGTSGTGSRVSLHGSGTVNVLDGAVLHAGQVFVVGKDVNIEGGAVIDTRGLGHTGIDSSFGYIFGNNDNEATNNSGPAVLAVANGFLNFLPMIGTGTMNIASGASLLTEGSIVIGAPGALDMGDVNFGARYLTVTQSTINAGDTAALAAAQASHVLQPGWNLNQTVLDRLLRPSSTAGVPALERLTLTAGDAINLFGTVALDARGQNSGGQAVEFVLNTPAIYGLGNAGDTASISADRFIWNGVRTGTVGSYASQAPAAIVPHGAGTGNGRLTVDAATVSFGYDADSRPTDGATLDRIAVGFADVVINARSRITGNSDGTLSVGLSQDADGKLVGGALTLAAPLVTAEAGATIAYKAGGAVRVIAPAGVVPGDTATVADQGGTVSFSGDSIFADTAFALPSGKLTLDALNDIVIGGNAKIDLAGRTIAFNDVNKYGWGGDLALTSGHGDITQNAGSLIDVSATYNQAGSISAIADDAAHGHIALNGTLRGSALSESQSGRIGLRAQSLGDFAALNVALNDAGFFGSRGFVLKQGDLAVGDEVRAHAVSISVDTGSLTVNGKIDASGDAPGNIRLASKGDLTIGATAVLDTHGNQLQTDNYGAPIEANNTAHVDLTTSQGQVVLASGATIDMRSPDGVSRGKLEINAPRLGTGSSATGAGAPANATANGIAISAAGPLDIRGAGSIAVNGFSTYTNAPADPDDVNGQLIDQAWLDLIHQDSTVFIDSALANGDLQNWLAGLTAYGAAFHLRPGVEIASATPDGNLTTKGDLDLSGYRYGPNADPAIRGSGETGIISFRAGGDLTIKGSINDGFAPPPISPDALTVLLSGDIFEPYTLTASGTLGAGSALPGIDDSNPVTTFSLDLPLPENFIIRTPPTANHPLPFDITLQSPFTLSGGSTVNGRIDAADGTNLFMPGATVPDDGAVLPAGTVIRAGNYDLGGNPFSNRLVPTMTVWPANADIYSLGAYSFDNPVVLPAGTVLPAFTSVASLTGPGDRKIWATAAMLAPGSQSWSIQLVGGADLGGADGRALRPITGMAAGTGNVVLSDPFNINLTGLGAPAAGVSVVRTGTGNLEILAGGSYRQDSPYGVYTAGTAVPETGTAANAPYELARSTFADGTQLGAGNEAYETTLNQQRMYYTEHGGDFLLMAQGDIGGNLKTADSTVIGDWLLRQGGNGQATAWGINFGSYAAASGFVPGISQFGGLLGLDAFSGMGAFGGGNVTLRAGGDIGNAGQGIVAAVGGSGRVMADGTLMQTGGGTLSVEAGRNVGAGGNQFVNLRGDTTVAAGNFGSLTSNLFGYNGDNDPRPLDPLQTYGMAAVAGGSFAPGDGTISVRTRGDLAMGTIDDPGRVGLNQYADSDAAGVQGATWFTLWTGRTAVDLFSAGGDVSPLSSSQGKESGGNASTSILPSILRAAAAGGSVYLAPGPNSSALMMPSPDGELELLARGSIIQRYDQATAFGPLSTSLASIPTPFNPAWVLRSWNGQKYTALSSNVWAPADNLRDAINHFAYSYDTSGSSVDFRHGGMGGTLFAFGPDTITDASAASAGARSRIYALNGDITGLHYGEVYVDSTFVGSGLVNTDYYRAAKPADILAGGDIVNLGGLILHADPTDISTIAAGGSVIYAGFNNTAAVGLQIAGPGTLEVIAGKNIYQGSSASIESIGPKVSGDTRPGADIVLQAGAGAGLPGVGQIDWTDFASRYLDPANLAGPGALAGQPGKVAMTYGDKLTLAGWLHDNYGYTGNEADAPAFLVNQQAKLDAAHASDSSAPQRNLANDFQQASQLHLVNWLETRYGSAAGALHYDGSIDPLVFFNALPTAQQRVLLRDVYYAELTAGGREYNDANGPRFGSYLRGRDAIAALFPQQDAYQGDIRMFTAATLPGRPNASAFVSTDFGGDIQLLAPGGQVIVGSEGLVPDTASGLITQGNGNIQIYSKDSVLLGLSRIMTTFGGNILAWSAEGDINAGRGSKTTVLFTPPKRTYDDLGDVALAPQVPSTGAGIATLNPISEVPPGDVDLIAPLGTIDAGEAGIRVSGNVNIAALHVVNAANIQVQGKSTGIPVVAAVNTSALTSASAAASSAANAAQDMTHQQQAAARQALPSIITVQVLGFGNEPVGGTPIPPAAPPRRSSPQVSGYDARSAFQVVGDGQLSPAQLAELTPEERRKWRP